MKRFLGFILAVFMMLSLCSCGESKKDDSDKTLDSKDPVKVVMEVKGFGAMTFELYPDKAPITVENFLKYVKDGFYDGLTFHRIVKDFMIQGGEPDGSKGQKLTPIKGEFSSNGVENDISHKKGVISMARTSVKDSATSQFFICHGDSLFLDGEYAAFGMMTDGFDVLDAIANVKVKMNAFGTEKSVPVESVIIEKVYVAE